MSSLREKTLESNEHTENWKQSYKLKEAQNSPVFMTHAAAAHMYTYIYIQPYTTTMTHIFISRLSYLSRFWTLIRQIAVYSNLPSSFLVSSEVTFRKSVNTTTVLSSSDHVEACGQCCSLCNVFLCFTGGFFFQLPVLVLLALQPLSFLLKPLLHVLWLMTNYLYFVPGSGLTKALLEIFRNIVKAVWIQTVKIEMQPSSPI